MSSSASFTKKNPLFQEVEDLLGHPAQEPTSFDEAARVIGAISTARGGIPDEWQRELDVTSTGLRGYVRGLKDKAQHAEEKSIKDAADGVYSQDVRVLYELMQNADDARYERAQCPELSFTLTPEWLHIDSNEDGFRLANVFAICSIGESSKARSPDTTSIGEKGVGFKSVFKVADYVSIQSAYWRFGFDHERKEPLSMIRPIVEVRDVRPEALTTRISLQYKKDYYNTLLDELQGLPDTATMFLRQISTVNIVVDGVQNLQIRHRTRRLVRTIAPLPPGHEILDKRFDLVAINTSGTTSEDETFHHTRLFRLFKQTYGQMPEEEKRPGITASEVQLAFPIKQSDGTPRMSSDGEFIFAFLPMAKQEHLPFLIQADFVTTISREDVVSNAWNKCLLNFIAGTFVESVKLLLPYKSFVYEWLRYLPSRQLVNFWSPLLNSIRNLLRQNKVIKTQCESSGLTLPSATNILPDVFLYEGHPLLPDPRSPTVYLAGGYAERGLESRLKELGVTIMTWDGIVERIEFDIRSNTSSHRSKVRETRLDDEWHMQFVRLLQEILEECANFRNLKARLWKLAVIPLSDETWKCAADQIYFPTVEGHDGQEVPEGLGFSLLHPLVSRSANQRSFYTSLGVSECETSVVCEKVFENHRKFNCEKGISGIVMDLRFLHRFGNRYSETDCRILLLGTSQLMATRSSTRLHFQSNGTYDAEQLLNSIPPSLVQEKQVDTDIILHQRYMQEIDLNVVYHSRTWRKWLHDMVSIRSFLPLANRSDPGRIAPLLQLILTTNSILFLGALRSHWRDYCLEDPDPTENPNLIEELKRATVSCVSGQVEKLSVTFLPTTTLREKADEIGVGPRFPFLSLPNGPVSPEAWRFLRMLGVGFELDLRFYLDCALCMGKNDELSREARLEGVTKIYERIGGFASADNQESIMKFFEKNSCIYNPGAGVRPLSPKGCIWEGPDFLNELPPLKKYYGTSEVIKDLFVQRIGIRNATFRDVCNQLLVWKTQHADGDEDSGSWSSLTAKFAEVYKSLAELVSFEEKDELKDLLEQSSLVYAGGEWCGPSKCIWNAPIQLPGKVKVGLVYPDLSSFFVDMLGVSIATAPVFLEEWRNLAVAQSGIIPAPALANVKDIMLQLGQLIDTKNLGDKDAFEANLKAIKPTSCLPVARASMTDITLRTPTDDFFVDDSPRYSKLLGAHLETLSFNIDECRRLYALLSLLGVKGRLLSQCVVEITSTPESSQLETTMTEAFRSRAYALAWCAAKFGSRKFLSNDLSTYERLCTAEIHTSDVLETVLQLRSRREQRISVKSDRVIPQVQDNGSGQLKIVLPTDKEASERCYRTELPKLIAQTLGIPNLVADQSLLLLLSVPIRSIGGILEDFDILPLSWIPAPPLPRIVDQAPQESTTAHGEDLGDRLWQSPPGSYLGLPLRHAQSSYGFVQSLQPTRLSQMSIHPDHSEYIRLLQNLKRVANGDTARPGYFSSIDQTAAFGPIRDSFDYRANVGAAGELFAFEILRNVGLPNFGYNEWQSKIRDRVKVHPSYADMPRWTRDDKDIVYVDDDGQLEEWLIDHGTFNDTPMFRAADPAEEMSPIKFYIEVKTSVTICNTRMYMSGPEYDRMEDCTIWPRERPSEVFVLFRVYDLVQEEPQYKVFVDPHRLDGEKFFFEPSQWAVTVDA